MTEECTRIACVVFMETSLDVPTCNIVTRGFSDFHVPQVHL